MAVFARDEACVGLKLYVNTLVYPSVLGLRGCALQKPSYAFRPTWRGSALTSLESRKDTGMRLRAVPCRPKRKTLKCTNRIIFWDDSLCSSVSAYVSPGREERFPFASTIGSIPVDECHYQTDREYEVPD